MKKNITELVFILDKSGSMSGLEADTIGGFNSMIAKQDASEGEVIVSTVLFSNDMTVLHDRISVSEVGKMTDKQYSVGGCTALLDAIGGAIHHIKKIHKKMEEEVRPDKTLFVITTDGQENASKKYNYEKVKKMVEKRKKDGWEFLFLGAGIDAISEAARFGIDESRAVKYECDGAGTALNFAVLGNAIAKVRRSSSSVEMSDALGVEWKEEIEEYYEKCNG